MRAGNGSLSQRKPLRIDDLCEFVLGLSVERLSFNPAVEP
jgi:hypothetical protein